MRSLEEYRRDAAGLCVACGAKHSWFEVCAARVTSRALLVLLVTLLLACAALLVALDLALGEAPPPVLAVTPADLADPLAVTLDPSRCILNRKTSAIRGTENRQGARVGLCVQDEGLPAAYRPAPVTR